MTTTTVETGTTGNAKGKPRVNAVTGIKIDKVDAALVNTSGERHKLELVGSLEQRVVQLWGHYDEKTPPKRRVVCADCHGLGDEDEDVCPYCGSDNALSDEDAARVMKGASVPKNSSPKTNGKKDGETTSTTATTATTATTEPKKKKGSTAIEKAAPAGEMRTEKDLDAAVSKVRRLKGEGATTLWKIGEEMADIYAKQLWKLRSEDGKPRYKTADAFCHAELGMTPQNAYSLMSVAEKFTEAQAAAWGTSKLGLLLQAPKEDQPVIQSLVESGANKSQVERAVREANKKARKEGKAATATARDGTARGSKLTGKSGAAPKQITVAKILGSQVVKLYKKPSTRTWEEKDLVRAKRLGDTPFAVIELSNDVEMHVTVFASPAGELSLRVNTKRVDDAEE